MKNNVCSSRRDHESEFIRNLLFFLYWMNRIGIFPYIDTWRDLFLNWVHSSVMKIIQNIRKSIRMYLLYGMIHTYSIFGSSINVFFLVFDFVSVRRAKLEWQHSFISSLIVSHSLEVFAGVFDMRLISFF